MIMAKSILWYQSTNINDEDKLYADGTLVDLQSKDYHYFFDKLHNLVDKTNEHRAPWCGLVGSTFVMKGFFKTKDEYGRNTAFLFACNLNNYKEELFNALKSIGMELDTMSIEKIHKVKKPISKKIILGITIIAIVLIILSVIIYGTGK